MGMFLKSGIVPLIMKWEDSLGKVLKLGKGISTIAHFHGASNPKVHVHTDNYYSILPGEKLANVTLTASGRKNCTFFWGAEWSEYK